jgi:hypothetical protein
MTMARSYPELVKRMPGIPKDLSYEALRLVRTETSAALGEATIRSAQGSPSATGIQYCLSSSHHIRDICDILATQDEAGLGPGIYPINDPPPYPAHPNTMSFLVVKHAEPEDFVQRLKKWEKNPQGDSQLESWYQKQINNTGLQEEVPKVNLPVSKVPTNKIKAKTIKAEPIKENKAKVQAFRQLSDKEIPAFVKQMNKDWNPTKQEIQAFKDYIGFDQNSMVDYGEINKFLRMGEKEYTEWYQHKITPELMSSIKDHITTMAAAIEKSKITENVILHRACDYKALLGNKMGLLDDETLQQLIGKTVIDNGFVSTSLKKSEIVNNILESKNVLFDIHAPEGTKGQYISNLAGGDKEEAEILLQKGTKIRIIDYVRTKRQLQDDLITVIGEVVN